MNKFHRFGTVLVSTTTFQQSLKDEVKQWINVITKAIHSRSSSSIFSYLFFFLTDTRRRWKLSLQLRSILTRNLIARYSTPLGIIIRYSFPHQFVDLDDIRIIMETMRKMREIEIDLDMKIEDVQQAFILIARYEYQLTKEDIDRVNNLEAAWLALQDKAMKEQFLLLEVQEHFQRELIKNLGIFDEVDCLIPQKNHFFKECNIFVDDYNKNGPMQEGLTPRQASDVLLMFQVCLLLTNLD